MRLIPLLWCCEPAVRLDDAFRGHGSGSLLQPPTDLHPPLPLPLHWLACSEGLKHLPPAPYQEAQEGILLQGTLGHAFPRPGKQPASLTDCNAIASMSDMIRIRPKKSHSYCWLYRSLCQNQFSLQYSVLPFTALASLGLPTHQEMKRLRGKT